MPRKPPTDRISASTSWFLIARSVISPTVSSFWLVTERPLSFDENISSLATDEYLASAGAVPVVVLAVSAAKTGLARTASDAATSAIFFILSSSEALLFVNAASEQMFLRRIANASGRCTLPVVVEPRQQGRRRVARHQRRDGDGRIRPTATLAAGGVAHHGRKPPRDTVCVAQIGVGEYHDDGAIVLGRTE